MVFKNRSSADKIRFFKGTFQRYSLRGLWLYISGRRADVVFQSKSDDILLKIVQIHGRIVAFHNDEEYNALHIANMDGLHS